MKEEKGKKEGGGGSEVGQNCDCGSGLVRVQGGGTSGGSVYLARVRIDLDVM